MSLVAGSLVVIILDVDALFGRSPHGVEEHGCGSPDQDALVHAMLLVAAPRLALVLERELRVDAPLALLVQRERDELLKAFAEGALGFGEASSRFREAAVGFLVLDGGRGGPGWPPRTANV